MEKIIIDPTESTPKVVLDPEKGLYSIEGESRPHDVPGFYIPLLEWLDAFGEHLAGEGGSVPVEFNFMFEYFNSLSAKYILDFCKKLNRLRLDGHDIRLNWHYEEEDDYMKETGHEMSRISQMPFEFVEITT
jgi:hypothetical protein